MKKQIVTGLTVVLLACFSQAGKSDDGRELAVLAESPNFVPTIICMLPSEDPEFDSSVRSVLERLNEDTAGHQILRTFRLGGLQPYRPDSIQAVRKLFEMYGRHRTPPMSPAESEPNDLPES